MAESKIDAELCSICLLDFQQPKILDCTHSFCFICLEDYIIKTSICGHFNCPLCRREITIPAQGFVSSFPDTLNSSTNVPQCDMCDDAVSGFRCMDCEQFMCKSCKTMHGKLPVCKGHVVVRLDETLECREDNSEEHETPVADVKDICPNHRDKNVDVFCKECSVAVCLQCFVSEHNGHTYSDLQDAVSRQNIRDDLNKLNTDIQRHIEKLLHYSDSLKLKYCEVTDSLKEACYKVDQQVVKICTEVKQVGETIKNEMKINCHEGDDSSAGEESMIQLMDDIKLLTRELQTSVLYTAGVLEHRSMVQVLDRLAIARQEHTDCSYRNFDIPKVLKIDFRESDIDLNYLRPQLGRIAQESMNIFEHGFKVRGVSKGQWVWSPEFRFSGDRWHVGVIFFTGKLQTCLSRKTGHEKYRYTIKLVNNTVDRQSVIKHGKNRNEGIVVIDRSKLCDPENKFMFNDIFTMQVTDIQIDLFS